MNQGTNDNKEMVCNLKETTVSIEEADNKETDTIEPLSHISNGLKGKFLSTGCPLECAFN